MTPQQKQLISELAQKYSEHPGTEALLAYVAETNGMLTACKTLLHIIKTGDSVSTDWLFRDCLKYNIVFHLFLEEISRLIALFDPNQENDDHFATLGLAPGAGKDEIKQAYRTLIPQYHPDTASPPHRDRSEKFIEINKAYNALLTAQDTKEGDGKSPPSKQWQKNRARRFSIGQKKKLYIWTSAALAILIIVSTVVLITTKNRAMLAGLQKGRTVLVGSIDTVLRSIQPENVTDSSHKQQRAVEQNDGSTLSPANKALLAVQEEQTEQTKDVEKISLKPASENFSPDPVIIVNNSKSPDTPKQPIVATSPDKIDIPETVTTVTKQPPENQPDVVNPPESVQDRSLEQQKAVEQIGFAPPSSPEKSLLAVQEEQTEQFPPDPVTTANNAKLPDTQEPSDTTTSPEQIDTHAAATTAIKQPLENRPSVVNHTKQHLISKSAPPDNSIQTSAKNIAVEMKQVQPDMQSRIDTFLDNYIKVYQQRNLILFSKFFEADAIENGKPFSSMLPTYKELFATTSDISLKVEKTSWQQFDGKIDVQGIFKFHIQYSDSRTFSGTGPIHFVLIDNNTSFGISVLEYDFVDGN